MINHSLSVTLIFVQDILSFCQKKITSNNYWRVPYSTTLDPLGATNPQLNWFFVLLFLFRTLYPQMLLVCFENLSPQGWHSKIANYPQDIVSLILSLSFFILSLLFSTLCSQWHLGSHSEWHLHWQCQCVGTVCQSGVTQRSARSVSLPTAAPGWVGPSALLPASL